MAYRKELPDHEVNTLEALIDSYSLSDVLEALSQVAYAKAEHIEAHWQDSPLASAWHKAGERLGQQAHWEYIREISL